MAGRAAPGSKKPLTEAQKAALARGQQKRRANIAARRASRGRQAASSQVSSLPSLARDALQPAAAAASQPEGQPEAAAGAPSPSGSGISSSPNKPRLSQEEQDALLFSFAMGDEDEQSNAAAASSEPGKKSSVGDKLASLLTSDSVKPTGNQQEDDAQQAAAQWQDLAAIGFIFIAGQIFGAELAPSEKQAQAMAAPLCRILMRHVTPLRNASADAYDIAAFAGAMLIYYQSISPELARRRAERKVLSASPKAQPAAQGPAAAGQQQQSQPAQPGERGNVRILHTEDTVGRGRYDAEPAQAGGVAVRQDEQQPYRRDAGASLISETLGVEL